MFLPIHYFCHVIICHFESEITPGVISLFLRNYTIRRKEAYSIIKEEGYRLANRIYTASSKGGGDNKGEGGLLGNIQF